MRKTLLVTNDFPPRKGGIQTYLEGFARLLDPEQFVVYCSSPPGGGAEEYDGAQPWRTYRYPGTMMLPTPRVRREMQRIIREHSVDNVWFGASTPLGIMGEAARDAGATHIIATTHGHEIGWSMLPGARQFLRRILTHADTVTYLTEATLRRLRGCLGDVHRVRLPGGIDPEAFAFSATWRTALRERYGIADDAPVVVCISRLVERKGQDTLIAAWPQVCARFPRAQLVIVGKGPYEARLRELAATSPAADAITFTGEVPYEELAAHYSLGDIFAMPCRTRGGGLDIEGLGIVYLEAYAAGLPAISGDSGGAPEAVLPGKTGLVASGHSVEASIAALCYLLEDPDRAKAMGRAGKEWLDQAWRWDILARPLLEELS
ncbi:glycosyltransferase family 4 protein [Actinobaculum sp. 352]|uniref:glycosyltransferase family 4 protein n=1 Tax=Actinobaculum sp. 352 TaxID=2490946 RepID=UPI000F7EF180|nr:glycosyltransferase family 4 protein [Actinobaculum sp. 352]RTE50762.1 glycosyltransferase family 1 protein [Actinobaculum sp. 352]